MYKLLIMLLLLSQGPAWGQEAPPELEAFARTAVEALEKHDWDAVLQLAEDEHYATQVGDFGMSKQQYIAELFGLNTVGNDLFRGNEQGWDDLKSIRRVRIGEITFDRYFWVVTGTVKTRSGPEYMLEMMIKQLADERYRLSGGVG